MEQQQILELQILHVTDLHCAYDKIEQLKEWLRIKELKLDMVLISGDVANIPMKIGQPASEEVQKEHHDHLHRIVTDFVSVADKVYFIAGNHDPITCFDTSAPLQEPVVYPLNVHCRKVQVAPNLHLLGVGGSVPFYQGEKLLLEGFPYKTDAEFGKELGGFLDPILGEEVVSPSDSYILMTHVGPSKSTTADMFAPADSVIIHAGSDILYEYLTKMELQNHTVLNTHGHTHPSIGMASIGSVSVINPGSLMEGHFGVYTLTMASGRKPAWKLSCASLHRLE